MDGYVYPGWANGIGWAIAMSIIAVIPAGFIYNIAWEQTGDIKDVSQRPSDDVAAIDVGSARADHAHCATAWTDSWNVNGVNAT